MNDFALNAPELIAKGRAAPSVVVDLSTLRKIAVPADSPRSRLC